MDTLVVKVLWTLQGVHPRNPAFPQSPTLSSKYCPSVFEIQHLLEPVCVAPGHSESLKKDILGMRLCVCGHSMSDKRSDSESGGAAQVHFPTERH